METLFAELKRYVAWSADDEAALRALHDDAVPAFERIADHHYQTILAHEEAKKALVGGESRVGQLKVLLVAWMDRLLAGPWDEDYYQLRTRIGRVHVRIALPQHYMFGAMNLIRDELDGVIHRRGGDPEVMLRTRRAVNKILDLELAIMLHTYAEDQEAQRARKERLATFGQLIGSIGHELRNPLAVIESSMYVIGQRTGGDERVGKHVARVGEQLRVANGIISTLLDMIRDRPLVRETVSLHAVAESALSSLSPPAGVRVAIDELAPLPPIEGDATQLRQVLLNLMDNAIHAVGAAGEVRLHGRVDDTMVELVVDDTGPGVALEAQRRLFEPLVTTKAKGIGLGLALVKRIVARHGGDIGYVPRPGAGARFVVRLPIGNAAR